MTVLSNNKNVCDKEGALTKSSDMCLPEGCEGWEYL